MNHEQAAALVLDMQTGRLEAATHAEVSGHARDCEECRGILSTFDALVVAMKRGEDDGVAHPEIDSLVQYGMEPEALDAERRREIEGHVESCPTCSRELSAVRGAESEHRASLGDNVTAFPRRSDAAVGGGWRNLTAVAAALVVTLTGVTGYLWLWQLPEARREIARLREQPAAESVLAPLPLFRSAVRDQGSARVIHVTGSMPTIPIAVAPALPRETGDAVSVRFEIADDARQVVFSVDATAGEIRALAGDSGVFALLAPTSALGPGEYTLKMTDLPGELVLLESRFSIVRGNGVTP